MPTASLVMTWPVRPSLPLAPDQSPLLRSTLRVTATKGTYVALSRRRVALHLVALNRWLVFTRVPEPGLMGGVIPCGPLNEIGILHVWVPRQNR